MGKYNFNKLSVIYDKRQKDFITKYPRRCDGNLSLTHLVNRNLMWCLPKDTEKPYPFNWKEFNFIEELEKRGYDITTLKFSIELKRTQTNNVRTT